MMRTKLYLIMPLVLGMALLLIVAVSGNIQVAVADDLHPSPTPTHTATVIHDATATHTATALATHTVTNTPVPPIHTATNTAVPPTHTATNTAVPPTNTPTKTPTRATLQGRFTGGGSIFTSAGVRVTHGFELYCSLSQGPNNLEINWAGNRFHLDQLTSVSCSLVNGVPTITGTGTGTYNGVSGATITFTFNDAGEPGRNTDFASITIKVGSTTVLQASGLLDSGNQQFHPAK